jgi:hypothetical protein
MPLDVSRVCPLGRGLTVSRYIHFSPQRKHSSKALEPCVGCSLSKYQIRAGLVVLNASADQRIWDGRKNNGLFRACIYYSSTLSVGGLLNGGGNSIHRAFGRLPMHLRNRLQRKNQVTSSMRGWAHTGGSPDFSGDPYALSRSGRSSAE